MCATAIRYAVYFFDPRDQRLRGRRGAMLGARDEIDEHVAALRPVLRPLRPAIEVGRGIAGLDLVLRAHQPRIGEIRGRLIDLRKVLVVGKHDRDIVFLRELVEFLACLNVSLRTSSA